MDASSVRPLLPSVLIVDDEPDICVALSDLLEHTMDLPSGRCIRDGRRSAKWKGGKSVS